jgi:hypothetical protein
MELALGFLFLVCVVELAFHAWERNNWSQERRELVQRIQAPEQAVVEHGRSLVEQAQPVVPIALDDDQAYEARRLRHEGKVPD